MPELMSVREFLDSFRIGRTTFYREVAAGRIRVIKIGRSTRVSREAAAEWLAILDANSEASDLAAPRSLLVPNEG